MKFYETIIRIDSFLEKEFITDEDFLKIKDFLKDTPTINYFWKTLDNEKWLSILYKGNSFDILCRSSMDSNELYRTQIFVSGYLYKISDRYPKITIDIIRKTRTDNSDVIRDFVEVGLKLNAFYTSKLINKVKEWIKQTEYLSSVNFAPVIINWVDHLLRGNEFNGALKLLKVLTSVKIQKDKEVKTLLGKQRPKAIAVIDEYYLKELLSQGINNLIEKRPVEVSIILSESLEKALKIEYRYSKDNQDLSYIWRPAIEDHPQNYNHYDFKDSLLVALRNTLEALVLKDTEKGFAFIQFFLTHKYSIFRRLAIHLLRLNYEKYTVFIKEFIKNRDLLNEIEISHEYYILLRDTFDNILDKDERFFIINSIKEYESFDPNANSEIQNKQKRYYWFEKLHFFEGNFTDKEKIFYESLKNEFQEEKLRDTPVWSESYSGEMSPLTVEELKNKNNNDLWYYLKTYRKTKKEYDAPTPEGLARTFGEVIKDNPERFLKYDLTPLIDLRPNYSFWFMSQVAELLKTEKYQICIKYIDNILTMCSRLIKLEDIPKLFTDDMRINFTDVKKRVLDIIQALIKTHQKEFSIEYKNKIWDIVEYLCFYEKDPCMDCEDETHMDPFTLALNSVRGTAMHTLVDYALWYAFHTKKDYQGFKYPNRFTGEERIQYLFEEKLNKKNDSSLAIHSTYGVFFSNLSYLNFSWVKENLDKIFPNDEENKKYWETAWAGYINASRFYSDLFVLLRPQFIRAIDYLSIGEKLTPSGYGRTPEDALSEHLVVACLNELDNIKNEDSLLRKFIEITYNSSMPYMVQFIANLAKEQKIFFDNERLNKKSFWPQAKELWKIRIDLVSKKLKENELANKERSIEDDEFDQEFSRYFSWLDNLPKTVTLKELEVHLRETIQINRRLRQIDYLLGYLKKESDRYPLIAIRLLNESLNKNVPFYFFQRKEDKIMSILKNAIKTDTDEAKYFADQIINRLGEWGIYDYKEFWMNNLKGIRIKKVIKLKKINSI